MVLAALMAVVHLRPTSRRPPRPRDLLRPCFEQLGMPQLLLWACRIWYRAAVRRELLHEPDGVLHDFGVTRDALRVYLRRPFWQP